MISFTKIIINIYKSKCPLTINHLSMLWGYKLNFVEYIYIYIFKYVYLSTEKIIMPHHDSVHFEAK